MRKKTIRTLNALEQHNLIKKDDLPKLKEAAEIFDIAITPAMHELIDKTNPNDPIAKQFVPSTQELNITANESNDPVGDHIHTKVKGIVHRYPDRCLLMPVQVCPVYCRFCFRKETVGNTSATLTPTELDTAFDYISEHKEIWEVILTGGDPLFLKPALLKKIITRLNSIEHVDVIRIHTRIPVVEPERIDQEMIAALASKKAIYVLLHANHPNEFSAAASNACSTLINAGIPMLSQTVLLKDINDNIETLSSLMRCFVKHRIKPYYLHHADLAKGTEHFRTSIQHGQQLMKELRGRFSGLCQPTYVLDIPGGHGKTPIGPYYLEIDDLHYTIEDYQGRRHSI